MVDRSAHAEMIPRMESIRNVPTGPLRTRGDNPSTPMCGSRPRDQPRACGTGVSSVVRISSSAGSTPRVRDR